MHTDADTLARDLVRIRRHLHAHPELGFQEFETSRFIRSSLEERGLTVSGPIARTGLFVDIQGSRPGPTVAYRADIDALPIQDAKSVPYHSTVPGVAHLCGHDAHTAMAIGVALLLDGRRDEIRGRVRVFFQPNEEGNPSGAPEMIRDGVLEGVDAVFAVHVDPTLERGRFGLRSGPITAAYDGFVITVRGPSTGHSARPHDVTDTVWTAVQIANALYQITGRLQDARRPAVLTLCRIHAGDALNVIPESVEFGGTLRSTHPDDRALLTEQIRRTATDIARLCGAEATVEFRHGAPPVVNNERLIEIARSAIIERMGESAVYDVPLPSMGSEDFAYYGEVLPAAMLRVGTADGAGTGHPLHDARFDLCEDAMADSALVLSDVLIDCLRSL